jgi:non-canonical purine NTP pyrophosphatase (RdgB/HAM1 family)
VSFPPFALVTGNPGKLVEVRRLLGAADEGASFDAVELDLPEIQSLDIHEVLRGKADEAWRRLGRPLVVEETGLYLEAMNGFPGPLVKWMLAAVGPEGIARAARALGDDRVEARCVLFYKDRAREWIAEGSTRGRLVLPGRGPGGFGWDPVFLPEGECRTYGELLPTEKDRLGHRGRAWRALREKLADRLSEAGVDQGRAG